jgi:hypothetical protein
MRHTRLLTIPCLYECWRIRIIIKTSSLSEWIGIKALAGKNAVNPDRNRLKPRLQSVLSDRLLADQESPAHSSLLHLSSIGRMPQ